MVSVEYAQSRCKGAVPGWNVPANTVLRITVLPKVVQKFSDLKIDMDKYITRRDDTATAYYASKEDGVEYEVSTEGTINSVSYFPSTKDSNLRCAGFPMDDGTVIRYYPFDKYSDLNFEREKDRLDRLAIRLGQDLDNVAYIVVYAGEKACADEAKLRANRAKQYLVRKRGLSEERVVAIDGGYRETLSVELYVVPQTAPPPNIVPTISPSEVKIIDCNRMRERSQ
jgi:hypothetical protein